MKLLILGATGFVGTNLFKDLKGEFDVYGSSKTLGVDFMNLTEAKRELKKLNPDIIINCAAHVGSLNYVSQKTAEIIRDNSILILNIYESIRLNNPNIKIINLVANCGYPGNTKEYLDEDNFFNGQLHKSVRSYGATRRLLLHVSEAYKDQYGIVSTNLILPNMYGPYDSKDPNKSHALNALINKFIAADQKNDKVIDVWGTGKPIREWLYSKDLSRFVALLLKSNYLNEGLFINVAQNLGYSISDIVNLINEEFNGKFKINYQLDKQDGASKKILSNSKFQDKFNQFVFTSIKDGIKDSITYYNHN